MSLAVSLLSQLASQAAIFCFLAALLPSSLEPLSPLLFLFLACHKNHSFLEDYSHIAGLTKLNLRTGKNFHSQNMFDLSGDPHALPHSPWICFSTHSLLVPLIPTILSYVPLLVPDNYQVSTSII